MSDRTNWRGMQLVRTQIGKGTDKSGGGYARPSDTNVKHMSMGSWHADARNGGARRRKGGGGSK